LYWKIDVPKQIDNKLNLKMNKSIARTDENKIYQIMQITDIHLDSVYFSGGESDCGEPLCCRRTDQKSSVKTRAGDWGSYPCDMPVDTVRNAFTEMSRNAKNAELWYWTGDIVPHDVWMYDKNNNLMNSEIIAKFLDEFAQTPVILAVGNHETVPVNRFDV
jgi:sphingomyelin phosphodiesterase